jgi:three-Cys-motif partner protein
MADVSFFDTPTTASLKKQRIVSKYVGGWANIVLPKAKAREGKIMYVDLFCGPGQYNDGTRSIPLLVLEHAINSPALSETLQTVFNDENADFIKTLEGHIAHIPGIERLRHQPILRNRIVGRDIIPRIKQIDVPTLFFADPWGYQGVSIDLIEAALTHWGSDFLFFFNYNRINMNLGSDVMSEPINEFFSTERANQIRETIARLRPIQREQAILKATMDAIKELGARAEKFTYRSETGARSTHHLVCVSKHRQGIALFKEISAKESTRFDDNVPSLDHNPGTDPAQGVLFSPLDALEAELVTNFAGKKDLTAEQIYHEHHNGKPYILKNYQKALFNLETNGTIEVDPPRATRRQPDTLPATAKVSFPAAG